MSRAFVDIKLLRAMCEKLTKLPGFENPEDLKTIISYIDDPIRMTATNLVRFFSKDLDTIDRMFSTFSYKGAAPIKKRIVEHSTVKGVMPLIGFVKGQPDQCIVFTNIPVNYSSSAESALSNVTPVSHYDRHMATFETTYRADMADENKKKRWGRGVIALKRHEQMTFARMLTKYFIFEGKKDDFVRDLADHIASERAAYELILGTTIEEYKDMYSSGPSSCMSYTKDKRAEWERAMQPEDPPTAFYSYIPGAFGATLKKKKSIHARCLVFTQDGKRRYSRVYFASEVAGETLRRMLQDEGITELPSGYVSFRASFKIPARLVKGSTTNYYMPYPYIDSCQTVFYGKFDRINKEFHIEAFPTLTNMAERKDFEKDTTFTQMVPAGTRGYLLSSELETLTCCQCSSTVKGRDSAANNILVHYSTGEFVCSSACMEAKGWVVALRGDGATQIMNKEETILDPCQATYYTTERAALELGANHFSNDLFAPDEEPGLSRYGHRLTRNNQSIVVDARLFEAKWVGRFKKVAISNFNVMRLDVMSIKKMKEVTLYDDMKDIVSRNKVTPEQQNAMDAFLSKTFVEELPPTYIQADAVDHKDRPIKLIRRV